MNELIDLTFKHNIDKGRHGWIRLTPAYSIALVEDILEGLSDHEKEYILDPFSGTGTTGLVSAEHGIPCDLYEVNPFLAWVTRAKTRHYNLAQIEAARMSASLIVEETSAYSDGEFWLPNLYRIERWWDRQVLNTLARVWHGIQRHSSKNDESTIDLLKIAFCRLLITWANVAFNHQSMAFKEAGNKESFEENITQAMLMYFESVTRQILKDASENPIGHVNVLTHNSKEMPLGIKSRYSCVITSPPYANRISYVREVRPYMYWLGFVNEGKQAADLDWNATGGAWGSATSKLQRWQPSGFFQNDKEFMLMVDKIKTKSQILANYVHRYFEDMYSHFLNLPLVLKDNAQVHYIIGNSKFYDVIVPTENIYAQILEKRGFKNTKVTPLRRRSSKKELYEYKISAFWKGV
jgi:hypothetical protein